MKQYIIYDGELYHHGVKGQKWGVRRKNKSSRKTINLMGSDDYRKAHKPKMARYMSDKELNDRNKRLGAEQKYRELKNKSSKGRLAVEIILKTAGAATVAAGAVYVGKKYLPQLLSSGSEIIGLA